MLRDDGEALFETLRVPDGTRGDVRRASGKTFMATYVSPALIMNPLFTSIF
jgi:hypothetical protein